MVAAFDDAEVVAVANGVVVVAVVAAFGIFLLAIVAVVVAVKVVSEPQLVAVAAGVGRQEC